MWDYCGLGVSERTVQADLQFMRSSSPGYDAPIVVVDKKYYTYSDPNYSILNAQVSDEDVTKIKEAVEILRQMSGFQAMEGMEDVVGRLEDHVASIAEKQKPIIYFERNDQLTGLHHLPTIYAAIQQKQVLRIVYKSFRAMREHEYLFSPYVLKEFRNRWFVFGRHTHSKMFTPFALDRIVSIEPAPDEPYKDDPQFDPEQYFDPIVEERMDGSMVFELNVQVNYELIRDLMGYAEGVQVLSPKRLVNIIHRKFEMGSILYS